MTLAPLRVGVVIDTFPSLSETFILNHITGLIDAGHEVTIFARRPPRAFPKTHAHVERYGLMSRVRYMPYQTWTRQQVLQVPYSLARSLGRHGTGRALNAAKYGWGVLRFRALHALETFKRERFDLLHCHYAAIGWAFASYGDIFGVPLVTSFHGDHYGSFGKDGGWLLSGLFRHANAFVANSEFTKGELIHLGCDARKIRVIPAMVSADDTQFKEPNLRRTSLRMITVARLHASKGIDVALHAVRTLLDRGHDVSYTVIGDGPHRSQFETLRTALHLEQQVTFSGWMNQSEVYAQYRNADLFVLPSLLCANGSNEAQGLVIQEAQLHGLPIVASHIGGVPESIDFGRAGRSFSAGDPVALADCVVEFLRDPDGACAMAYHAEQYVRGKYTQEPVMRGILQLYEDVLSCRSCKLNVANVA